MKRILTLVILLSLSIDLSSQTLYDTYDGFFSNNSSDNKNETQISQMVKYGFDDIFKYTFSELNQYKDSIIVLSKIQSVSIELRDSTDLEKTINHLTLLPNLKFLKFKNLYLFKKSAENLPFPNNLRELNKLETIIFEYYSDWDHTVGFNKLMELPKLINIGFYGFPRDIFLNKHFLKLKKLEGILYSSRNSPIFPQKLKTLKFLKSVIISTDFDIKSIYEFKKLSQVKSLENLVLAYLDINDTIANSFKKFKSLKRLNLNSCKITSPNLLFSAIGKKNKLTELKLSNNKIEKLPNEIKYFKNLENFYSSNNQLGTELPLEFYSLTKLKSIEIQGSTIEIIDDKINNLKSLEVLKIYFNQIYKFSEKLDNLKKLSTLYLNNNKLNTIPKQIGKLSSLKYLKIDDNEFSHLPESISHLRNLDTLICANSKLIGLPKNFGSLNSLEYLDLNNSLIKELPESFINLKNLTFLNIEQNDIKMFPEGFGKLSSLKTIKASYNFIETLPSDFCELSKLKTLELTQNKLQHLSENFGNLKSLERLMLNNREDPMRMFTIYNGGKFIRDSSRIERNSNDLKSLPSSLKNLVSLKYISLSMNENISETSIFNILKNNTYKDYRLELDYCNIDSLPKTGWVNSTVRSLNLSNNNIKKLPQDIKNAKHLSELNLKNNSKNLNTYSGNREQLNILFAEEGFLSKEQLPKTIAMAKAYAKVANREGYSGKYEKVVEYAERAIDIDPELAMSALYDDNFIEALYKTENYKKAIIYADLAIAKDTSSNVRLLNSIVPNFRYKAKSELAIGDTLEALETLTALAKNFDRQSWSEIGILSIRRGNDSLAKVSFNNTIKYYRKHLKNRPNDWGYQLSLLEIYVIADQKELAEKLHSKLTELIDEEDYKILLEYFKVALNIIYEPNLNTNKECKRFQSFLTNKKTKLNLWSFELFLDWNEINKLNAEKKSSLKTITNLLRRNDLNFFD
ncbi:hypothetical protein JBL43_18795 [Aureibaculum sp. A20]|uniref:Disease resistance R13L4/SHOC-2-like LRR domain-containing protein n=1 Tax=Aureibaculum flavum TaxID=2795986 RepID=A0ABS0WWC9_9FLAO|nr:hypothetical protein [Aureibaculum flavum]MBJ2176307.1 hypothetical protein [Aureibaculum flavum]